MRNPTLKPSLRRLNASLSRRCASSLAALGLAWLSTASVFAQATVTTIGGGNVNPPYSGYVNGNTFTTALFAMPTGMALDASGNLYLADYTNNAIRIVSQAGNTASSMTTTWTTNGVSRPLAVVLDGAGDVYVLNHGNGNNGAVLHFTGAGGAAVAQPALASGLVNATSMARDGQNNLYVTVNGNKVIRVTPAGVVTNIGTISGSSASLQGIAVLDTGKLALTDAGNNGIWIMDAVAGTATALTGFHGAGDVLGASSAAAFRTPEDLAEAGGGILVVADRGNNKVKLVDTAGNVSLLYGISSNLWNTGKFPGWVDGTAGAAKGDAEGRQPYGVLVAPDGSVFTTEVWYHLLRQVTGTGLTAPPAPGSPGSGTGSSGGSSQVFGSAEGIAFDDVDNFLFITSKTNNAVQILDLNATTNATYNFVNSQDGVTNPVAVLLDAEDNLYVLNQGKTTNGYILEFDIYGNSYGQIVTGLNKPTAFTMDGLGNIFVTLQSSNIFTFGTGVSNTIVSVTNANVSLQGIALFDDGTLAVSDAGNHVIWAVNPITTFVTKLTGKLGVSGTAVGATNFAEFNEPHQLVRAGGDQIIGADYGNNRLVLISRTGTVTTNHFNSVTGATIWYGNNATDPVTGTNSSFVPMVLPFGVAVDDSGDVFDSESFYGDIRRLTSTTIGSPSSNPGVPLPVYSHPAGMSLNNESTILYVADPVNNTVSALNLANNQTTVFLDSTDGIYQPVDLAVDINDNVYVLNQGTGGNGSIMEFDEYGNFLGTIVSSLPLPTAMKRNFAGAFNVAEQNGLVQQFSSGVSNTLANITTNAKVSLNGIAVLDTGSVVVSDTGNDVIWLIAPGATNAVLFTGVMDTPGATFGAVGFAKLWAPMGLATVNGGELIIADSGNNRIVLANDSGAISSALDSTNANLWFGLPTDPLTPTSPNFVNMLSPAGLVLDANGTVFDSETVYKVIRGILNTGLQPPIKPAPPAAPQIGWYDYEENNLFQYVSVMHPVTGVEVFNNDELLAINPTTNGVSTYYVYGPAPLNSVPSATNGSTPPFYQNGIVAYGIQPLPSFGVPDLVIDAVNVDSIGQQSPITTAEFKFEVANPTVTGFNGAQFTVSEITTNAVLWYTLDGTDPTNAAPSIGPVSLNSTNTAVLSLVVNSNVLFKVRGFRDGYLPSGIAEQFFSPSNFVANTISFGFASGEASSAFVASPGQTYYAPVTLSILPGVEMYSLQFNIVATNAGPNPGPAIAPDAFGFQSMLMKPLPNSDLYVPIPPYMFVGDDSGPVNPAQLVNYEGTNFVNLLTTDTALNLLGVGWLERYTETNLYPTLAQDLIQFSLAHDDLFLQSAGEIIVGGYEFQVPQNAVSNQTYQIQIARPSATSDGIGAPGSAVYIAAPTNETTGAGSINALKFVTIGQIQYLVGSVYPFRWFNAGDFGSSNIVNADVEQVFQSAIYLLNNPPPGSDFFDAMDSCGSYGALDNNGTDPNFGFYTNSNTTLTSPGQTSPLFSGDDTTINQVIFGDGQLDVCDVYVTFRRSLDPSLTWYQRFWNNGVRVAAGGANVASNARKAPAPIAQIVSKALNTSDVPPQVNFWAGDVIGAAGQTVQVPINATILGNYPLRLLMLNLTVTPLDGSPALTVPVSFSQTAATLGAPYTTDSEGNGNFSAVWLNSTNSGLTGTVTLGTLSVAIPSTASSLTAYAIHFDHASASPNGLASFPNEKLTGLLTTTARTNSTYGDGIPDSWRLIWFGTVNNLLSTSNACPSGDGVPNWMKYVAGVDPNKANDFPSTTPKTPAPSGSTTAIQWPSVYGTQYVILRANSLFGSPWTILSTNTGTGGTMEFDDTSSANTRFYRVEILPP